MNKLLALYRNEMIKFSHQLFVWLLALLMVVTAFLAPLLYLKGSSWEESSDLYYLNDVSKSDITKRFDSAKEKLGDPNQHIKHATLRFNNAKGTTELFATYLDFGRDDYEILDDYSTFCTCNTLLTKYNFDQYPINDTWLASQSYLLYVTTYSTLCSLNMIPFEERDNDWLEEYEYTNQSLELFQDALFNHSFESFVAQAELESTHGAFSYLDLDLARMLAKLDPYGQMNEIDTIHLLELLESYFNNKNTLLYGFETLNNGTAVPLSDSRRVQIENSVQIMEYQFEHQTYPTIASSRVVNSVLYGIKIGQFFLIIAVILIAATSMASEMATGSIKSLIIAPVKRWKIFTAKLACILTWIIAGSLLVTFASTLSVVLKNGISSFPPYYYVVDGSLRTIPYLLFLLLYFLVSNIPLLVYMLVSFAISCNSKNSGAAVAISLPLVLSTSSLSSFLINLFGNRRWIDFLPSRNIDLIDRIFTQLPMIGIDNEALLDSSSIQLPLRFSVIYLIVFSFTILLIAFDAFVRRDIQ